MMKSIIVLSLLVVFCQTCMGVDTPVETKPALRTMRYSSRSADEARLWQQEVRSKLAKLMNMDIFPSNPKPKFDVQKIKSFEHSTFTIEELEINSTTKRRMRILVTIPKNMEGPFPAVVGIGGHSSVLHTVYTQDTIEREPSEWDKYYKSFGTVLAQRGYVTITTHVSQHEIYEEGATLMGERIWDLMRCVDYLESMPQVDAKRIGCAGLSLGGELAMWLPAMDERVYASVSAGFLTMMDQLEQGHCMCWKFDGLRELVDFPDIYALIAPRPLQCQNGIQETPVFFCVPLAQKALEELRPIYVDMGQPENLVLDVHEGGHEIDLPGLVSFFEKHLQNNRFDCGRRK